MATASDIESDREELYRAIREHRRPDPEVARRVHERAEKVREEILRLHGVQNIGTDIIREFRDAELPADV
ncbi:MAG: hypothetical protein JSS27_16640 [Planctomycetes bacterium]|nr:hypothetical protein [Planctomycetota bacterium]